MIRLPRNIVIDLPESHRATYLGLATLWREMQELMVQDAEPERPPSEATDAFLPDPVAEYLSSVVIRQLMDEAFWASGERGGMVSPRLHVDADLMLLALGDLSWHSEWLERDGVLEALGIRRPDRDVLELRTRVINVIGRELARETGWPRAVGSTEAEEPAAAS